jgi:hypothetical protein
VAMQRMVGAPGTATRISQIPDRGQGQERGSAALPRGLQYANC